MLESQMLLHSRLSKLHLRQPLRTSTKVNELYKLKLHALYHLGTRFFCYALFALSTGEHTESSAWEGFFYC